MNTRFRQLRNSGFTLIELLIVVIIVAILAAIVIPQFRDSSEDAKLAALDANLAAMRSAVELYRVQHKAQYPGATSSNATSGCTGTTVNAAANSKEAFVAQLTMATNADGWTCSVADSNFKYGPYLKQKIPADPFKNSAAVLVVSSGSLSSNDAGGWAFHTANGQLIANLTAHSVR